MLIAVHLVLRDPSGPQAFSWVRNLLQEAEGEEGARLRVSRVLSSCPDFGPDDVGHGFSATDVNGREDIDPYHDHLRARTTSSPRSWEGFGAGRL